MIDFRTKYGINAICYGFMGKSIELTEVESIYPLLENSFKVLDYEFDYVDSNDSYYNRQVKFKYAHSDRRVTQIKFKNGDIVLVLMSSTEVVEDIDDYLNGEKKRIQNHKKTVKKLIKFLTRKGFKLSDYGNYASKDSDDSRTIIWFYESGSRDRIDFKLHNYDDIIKVRENKIWITKDHVYVEGINNSWIKVL